MTEQTSLGGLALATDPRSAMPSVDMADGSSDNRRKLAVVGAAVAVLVLLIAVFFLMKGKGSPAQPAAPDALANAGTTAAPAGAAAAPAKAVKPVTLPKHFNGSIGRDPFKPEYVAPAAKSTDTAASGTPTTAVPVGTPVPVTTTPGTTGSSTPTTTTGSGTGLGPSWVPVWVDLARVSGTRSATFIVGYSNGKRSKTLTYSNIEAPTTGVRTVFASVFSLLSIQNGTATVQIGDGTPFDLQRGFSNRHYVG